jgi:hypothetical protein
MSRWVAASICFVSIWLVAELYGQSADDGAIRRQFAAYAEARQRGDSKAQASFYSEDADEWRSVNRRMLKGREEIAKDLGLTANTSRTFRLDIENVVLSNRMSPWLTRSISGVRHRQTDTLLICW